MSNLAPNPTWEPLNEKHLSGKWWRCTLARQMLSLTDARGKRWDGAGMRDPANTMQWVETMAVGYENEDADFLPQGAVNFWHWASIRFNSWKKQNGLE